jgi:hypothetical protein
MDLFWQWSALYRAVSRLRKGRGEMLFDDGDGFPFNG